jgi:hypothetical protein
MPASGTSVPSDCGGAATVPGVAGSDTPDSSLALGDAENISFAQRVKSSAVGNDAKVFEAAAKSALASSFGTAGSADAAARPNQA